TNALNRSLVPRIVQELRRHLPRDGTVAVLGLAYKPASHVVEESQAVMIVNALLEYGARVLAYDPLARESANHELGGRALIMDSPRDCLREADLVVIATPDPEFGTLTPGDFRAGGRRIVVVDCWRILRPEIARDPQVEYIAYGRGPQSDDLASALKQLWAETAFHHGA